MQNTEARLTVCMKKTDRITSVLKKLHWLPVNDRIIFKLLWTNGSPRCILMSGTSLHSRRYLRSSDSNFLVTPKTITVSYGDRPFAAIAPKLWNQLPLAIKVTLFIVLKGFENAPVL